MTTSTDKIKICIVKPPLFISCPILVLDPCFHGISAMFSVSLLSCHKRVRVSSILHFDFRDGFFRTSPNGSAFVRLYPVGESQQMVVFWNMKNIRTRPLPMFGENPTQG